MSLVQYQIRYLYEQSLDKSLTMQIIKCEPKNIVKFIMSLMGFSIRLSYVHNFTGI